MTGKGLFHIVNRLIQEHFDCHDNPTPPNTDGTDLPRPPSVSAVAGTVVRLQPALDDALKHSTNIGIDDKKFLLEHLLTLMAETSGTNFARQLECVVIDFLYKDLPHPPSSYVSLSPQSSARYEQLMSVNYAYRSADGSNYNVLLPTLGMAGAPYARTVPNTHPLPEALLPDPGLVFDMLLKRDKFVPHPGGISSLFFAFADLVIHSIFNTNPRNSAINNASSYLDLSPLYGSSTAEVDNVRRKDGTGKLWNDVFSDRRLLFMPPSTCALLVLLNRNHNYIAETIMKLNEKGTFKSLENLAPEQKLAQDEEIFQRSRLVNCGLFMQIILGDYVGAILGLVRDGYSWRLPVREEPLRRIDHTLSPCGEGNVVSIEFNLMYRWHSTLSEADTLWTEKKFKELFPGKDLAKLTRKDFGAMYQELDQSADVKTWSFADLQRSVDGKFDDAALAKILQDATATSASAFKARGIPEALRVVEVMGIEQARRWGTCTLNEFRKFMGLKPYASFAEWNSDPSVYTAAEVLYHNIDSLELHVGLQAEQAKDPMPGAGLCPGYTMSRAILADAVCLTRGDRFMTTELTPQNLTAWGYQDCQFETGDGSYGGMLTKLLFRTLPRFYSPGSTYAHFPFMIPEAMMEAMKKNDPQMVNEYTWTRPVPGPTPQALGYDTSRQRELCEQRLATVTGFQGENVLHSLEGLLSDCEFRLWGSRFSEITSDLIRRNSVQGPGITYVDIVRDVLNIAPVQWIAEEIGYPLKDEDSLHADSVPRGLCWGFSQIASYIYLNISPEREYLLKHRARAAAQPIYSFVRKKVEDRDSGAPYMASLIQLQASRDYSAEHCAAAMIGDVIATAPFFSRSVARILDHLLNEPEEVLAHWQGESPESLESLERYVREALLLTDDVIVHHGLMNTRFFCAVVPQILRTIMSLPHADRASGQSGLLKGFIDERFSCKVMHLNAHGRISPWPTAMLMQYAQDDRRRDGAAC